MRNTNASSRPICRARLASCGEQRETRTEMNTMLSMPRTISSAVKVTSAAQALGSVKSSNIALPHQPRPQEVQRDGTQRRSNPQAGHHVARKRDGGENGPDHQQRYGE